jgi:hypothetical protein
MSSCPAAVRKPLSLSCRNDAAGARVCHPVAQITKEPLYEWNYGKPRKQKDKLVKSSKRQFGTASALLLSAASMFAQDSAPSVEMRTNERMLIENVYASCMASECFYAWGTTRQSTSEPKQYQKSLTYLRCSVTDCASNAFNQGETT